MAGASRYELLPGLLLGFHGTDEETAEKVLSGKAQLKASQNKYDWLGHGVYFWEYSPERALEFAQQSLKDPKVTRGKIVQPAVIGAVIDPGLCLNLLESSALRLLSEAFTTLKIEHDLAGLAMPENKGGEDLRARHLDCAVIQTLHSLRTIDPPAPPYDTVRGAFWEGEPLYPNAGFKQKNHVQICVRNTSCIKGYFRVLE